VTGAVETTPPRSAESGPARGSDPAAGAADGERARDLLAGERVWEAAWGAWATARAAGADRGADG